MTHFSGYTSTSMTKYVNITTETRKGQNVFQLVDEKQKGNQIKNQIRMEKLCT